MGNDDHGIRLHRCGVRDPTRAALNPGLWNEMDKRLHEWAIHNGQGIAAIIAGRTRRAVFENLSLTERRYLESKVKRGGVTIEHPPDGSYSNTGSCVHPLSITGIEITLEGGLVPRLCHDNPPPGMGRMSPKNPHSR